MEYITLLINGKHFYRIFVIDNTTRSLYVFDEEFNEIIFDHDFDGLNNLLNPSDIDCIPSDDSKEIDCFILDTDRNSLIWFRLTSIGVSSESIELLYTYVADPYVSAGTTSSRRFLYKPCSIETVKLDSSAGQKILIYIGQASSAVPALFEGGFEDGEAFVRYYSTLGERLPGVVTSIVSMDLLKNDSMYSKVFICFISEREDFKKMTLLDLPNTARITAFSYAHQNLYQVLDAVHIFPTMHTVLNPPAIFASDETLPEGLHIDLYTGVIGGTIAKMPKVPIETRPLYVIRIIGWGAVNFETTNIQFVVGCGDGFKATVDPATEENICVPCELGSYNNVALARESLKNVRSCSPCGENLATAVQGARSSESCVCAPGYEADEKSTICQKCLAGQWKSGAGNVGCQGQCYPGSSSDVLGATSALERECACEPGKYFVPPPGDTVETSRDEEGACEDVALSFFSPGGHHAPATKCPDGTTTSAVGSTNLSDCICDLGHRPATSEELGDTFLDFHEAVLAIYPDVQDDQICVPCELNTYKDVLGPEECQDCAEHTRTEARGSTQKERCSVCNPGYYLDQRIGSCEPCPEGFFCPGQIWDQSHWAYNIDNKAQQCPANSVTSYPVTSNSFNFSCMCDVGYYFESLGSDKSVYCSPASRDHYASTVGNEDQAACPGGTKTLSERSTTELDCACRPGTSWMNGQCETCAIGHVCAGGRDFETFEHVARVNCLDYYNQTTTFSEGSSSLSDCICTAGHYTSSTENCVPCELGYYKSSPAAGDCTLCPQHSYTEEKGSTSRTDCKCHPGYYFDNNQCPSCTVPLNYCPGGVDEDGEAQMPLPCPAKSVVPTHISTPSTSADCECLMGYERRLIGDGDEAECQMCPTGSYKTTTSNDRCEGVCMQHATSLEGAISLTQCYCYEGYYLLGEICHICPPGGSCPGGFTEDALDALQVDPWFTEIPQGFHIMPYAVPEYYASVLDAPEYSGKAYAFMKCPGAGVCVYQSECSPNNEGFLCGECKEGYTNGFQPNMCAKCPDFAWNAGALIAYGLFSLGFNIGMTYINAAAGVNRRSIHSIVIKIASNYATCMSILFVLEYPDVVMPQFVKDLVTLVRSAFYTDETEKVAGILSLECFVRHLMGGTHADSLFYSSVVLFCLPVFMLLLSCVIVVVLVAVTKVARKAKIRQKIDLLAKVRDAGLDELEAQLVEQFDYDRILMTFRYIRWPGQTLRQEAMRFCVDMIPLLVTILFFVHTRVTRAMLVLFSCRSLDIGNGLVISVLDAAPSIECVKSPDSEFFSFYALGLTGFFLWGLGIPLVSFIVLYINRKSLNTVSMRLRYGFLHNGYIPRYWWWESLVYFRKVFVLLVSVLTFNVTAAKVTSVKLYLSIIIASIFGASHLLAQPFDGRNYCTLDKLEGHSMSAWAVSLILAQLISLGSVSENTSFVVVVIIVILNGFFLVEVSMSLFWAYANKMRHDFRKQKLPFVGGIFRAIARMSERRSAKEAVVLYDEDDNVIKLIGGSQYNSLDWLAGENASKATKLDKLKLFRSNTQRTAASLGQNDSSLKAMAEEEENHKERYGDNRKQKFEGERAFLTNTDTAYFITVIKEAIQFALVHLKLSHLPGIFLEFVIRLGLTYTKIEENITANNVNVDALAKGDLTKLEEWLKRNEKQKQNKSRQKKKSNKIKKTWNEFYNVLEKKVQKKIEASEKRKQREGSGYGLGNPGERPEGLADLSEEDSEFDFSDEDFESGSGYGSDLLSSSFYSSSEDGDYSDSEEGEAEGVELGGEHAKSSSKFEKKVSIKKPDNMLDVSDLNEEAQTEIFYLFDGKTSRLGISLSDLYLSFLKMQMKKPDDIAKQFEAFKARKMVHSLHQAKKAEKINIQLRTLKKCLNEASVHQAQKQEGISEMQATVLDFAASRNWTKEEYDKTAAAVLLLKADRVKKLQELAHWQQATPQHLTEALNTDWVNAEEMVQSVNKKKKKVKNDGVEEHDILSSNVSLSGLSD